jgi:tetratricopeptide (TPR) repeat protein
MLASQKLRKAAAYAVNRDRLKRVITSGWEERAVIDSPLVDRPVSVEQMPEKSASAIEEVFLPASPVENLIAGATPDAEIAPPPVSGPEETENQLEIETPADLLFDRLVVPLQQPHNVPHDPDDNEEPEEPPLQLGHLNEDDFAIEEFSRRSKKHVQNEIIESFIRTEPRITSQSLAQRDTYPSRDLAEKSTKPVKIVSENMANIYIRQRKYDKAIQLFEQLILKYPEKKENFVKRIEELKQL